jgi:hypothetical protein
MPLEWSNRHDYYHPAFSPRSTNLVTVTIQIAFPFQNQSSHECSNIPGDPDVPFRLFSRILVMRSLEDLYTFPLYLVEAGLPGVDTMIATMSLLVRVFRILNGTYYLIHRTRP